MQPGARNVASSPQDVPVLVMPRRAGNSGGSEGHTEGGGEICCFTGTRAAGAKRSEVNAQETMTTNRVQTGSSSRVANLQRGPGAPSERAFWIGLTVVVLSLVSALATYLILTGLTPIAPSNNVVVSVLFFNVVLIIAMIAVIAWQARQIWRAWRERVPGARLHARIVALFSVIAALPAILLAVAATTTFSRSIDGWFSKRTRVVIENSHAVAKAYLIEHGKVIRTDVANMTRDLDASADLAAENRPKFLQLVIAQAALRDLPAVYIIDGKGTQISNPVEDASLPFSQPEADVMELARNGQVPVLTPKTGHSIAAISKIKSEANRFLYALRNVSPTVIRQLTATRQSVSAYNQLRQARGGLKLAHGLMYLMISMTALLAAIWAGLWFASRFVAPIRRLIGAAEEVSGGNLSVSLPERRGEGDLRRLSQTFNRMTRELKTQHDALVTANDQLTDRRRFIEAVLSGVSAGVIGLDSQGQITLVSRSAQSLLNINEEKVVGKKLSDALPVFAPILEKHEHQGLKAESRDEISISLGDEERTFAVRVTREEAGEGDVGSVVTLDDITELVSAQRSSAWADVARRIAHEIKNPLTPIILSVERLRRKYANVLEEDQRATFEKLTETIERQAGDIKSMVDEFASFARIPKPVIEAGDFRDVVQEPVILFREGHPAVAFRMDVPDDPVRGSFDRRLMTQAVTNLVKNATEAVESAAEKEGEPYEPQVVAALIQEQGRLIIQVTDNGIGLPKSNRNRLLEPYVTTKGSKGTGLGLAIVQKIVEQHGGTLVLEDVSATESPNSSDAPARGARVRLILPHKESEGAKAPEQDKGRSASGRRNATRSDQPTDSPTGRHATAPQSRTVLQEAKE